MTQFEEELKKGKFVCSECQNCKKLVWPPNNYCNRCFGQVKWRPVSQTAKLIEFSKKDNIIFCISEFENEVRVMGALQTDKKPVIGQELILIKCGYNGKEEFIFQPK
jgi:hypothetical protein